MGKLVFEFEVTKLDPITLAPYPVRGIATPLHIQQLERAGAKVHIDHKTARFVPAIQVDESGRFKV